MSRIIKTIKNSDGTLNSVTYEIHVPHEKILKGILSREDLEKIYSYYSKDGFNYTCKQISKFFLNLSPRDLKNIFKTFNITKDCCPLPPHLLEELCPEDAKLRILKIKESSLVKSVVSDSESYYKSRVVEMQSEIIDLKNQLESYSSIISDAELEKIIPYKQDCITSKECNNIRHMVIYLSDMHIGAFVNNEGVYSNTYDENETRRRLTKIIDKIIEINPTEITVFNLGDAIDGFDNGTTRRSHGQILPQNMSNKEQVTVFIKLMWEFFNNIIALNLKVPINFISVSESNHGGAAEFTAVFALSKMLEHRGVSVKISDRPIDSVEIENTNVIFLHGYDSKNQFKNFPLTVNDRVESFFSEYIIRNELSKKGKDILIVKGDLHQSATTQAKCFIYKSVGSLFGSSNWIHSNFGQTPWGCDYSIFTKKDRIDGLIKD